ncbi:MAG: NAD-dependent epimerase/dehydratase family protein, partial [bacterium]|nr:NAD-dependent epimerase/dehydratase family protein [bacterium]
QFDLNVRCVRLFNIVGPRQTGEFGRVVPRFVRQAVEGRPISVFGDGSQTRCFTDVRDAVRAMDLLGGCFESKGEVVNVGSRNEVSIHTLARMVQDQSPMATGITFTPYKEAYGEHFDETYHRRPSLKKLESLIPFRCEWTLKDTISDLTLRKLQQLEEESVENRPIGAREQDVNPTESRVFMEAQIPESLARSA